MGGKVKGETTEEDCHLIPIAAETELGLCPRKWVGRVLEAYERLGVVSGWMFKDNNGVGGRPSFYDAYMFEWILRIHTAGSVYERLQPSNEEVIEVYGIGRSGRRGYATHATNVGISDADIKRLVRCRVIEGAAGRAAPHYREVRRKAMPKLGKCFGRS
jgi:hypothetical protein